MSARLAINGYGRIGRCLLRALHESGHQDTFEIVAINEPADLASMAYLTRFDSTHGRFPGEVFHEGNFLVINERPIVVSHATSPKAVAWGDFDIDVVVECSGQYSRRAELQSFIDTGCPRLLLSHPGHSATDVDLTVVYGVNDVDLRGTEQLVSNASCTTNAAVPVLSLLDAAFGIDHALLTTLHSVMNDQPLIDGYHPSDLRRSRSAMQSIIPVSTGLVRGVERLLPQLEGRVDAKAIRVPTLNVSAIDLVLTLQDNVDKDSINAFLRETVAAPFQGLVGYSDEAHASIDFNHDPRSAIIDLTQTRVCGNNMVNLLIWFDNEWGFTNRLIDILQLWHSRWSASTR